MMAWQAVPLGEVLVQDKEYITELEPRAYKKLSVKLYGKGVVVDGSVEGTSVSMKRHQLAKAGQIIVSEIWAKKGAIGIIPSDGEGALCTSHFFLFKAVTDRITIGWMKYFLAGNFLEHQLYKEARGTTGYAAIRPRQFLACTIPLPPLDEQRRIVARLDRVAALVEERRQAVQAAERETHALLLKAFERATAGAPYRPMAEVAPLIRRPVEVEPDERYPELGVRSFGRGTFHKPALAGMDVGSKKLFHIHPGDLLFNIVFAWEGAIAIAQVEDRGRVGSHRFLTCVPDPAIATATFLLFYFLTREGLQKIGEASPGGAGRNRTLGLKKLEAITVPVPPIERQNWFGRLQAKAREIRDVRIRSSQGIDELLPALLHEVFNSTARAG